jgi:hypothetical protein
MTFGTGHTVVQRDEDVGRLEVAMDDSFLVRMLDRVADGGEESEPIRGREVRLIAVVGDANAAHQFHDEERTARRRCTGIENPGDIRMIHHRQRLPLLLETRDDLTGVHAHFDDLQRHAPPHRLLLLGHPHRAEAALADFLEQFVWTNLVAGFLGLEPCEFGLDRWIWRGAFQKLARLLAGPQQLPHVPLERFILRERLRDECLALFARTDFEGFVKCRLDAPVGIVHGRRCLHAPLCEIRSEMGSAISSAKKKKGS